jgi:putative spermidine/putrescine transport system permease protein
MVAILLPFAVVPLTTRMRAIDPVLLQAARNLGAGRLDCFLRVHLPLSLPGVVAGASLVFVLSLGFFITPSLLGGTRDITVAMLIMQQFQALLNWGFGAALSAMLLLLAAITLLVFAWAGRMAARGVERA